MAERKTRQDDEPPQRQGSFPIVGVGASAGGVQALQTFFTSLSEKTGAAFVVILHLDPTHQSDLGHVLAARTKMPVSQIDKKTSLAPDHVYVIPPDRRLLISGSDVSPSAFDEPRGQRAPIDIFFRSMAAARSDIFAIILSGAGVDGTLGVKAVKETGGITMVQDPNEAEHASMPRSAIATGQVDFVLPVRDLAIQLASLIRGKAHLTERVALNSEDEAFGRILAHLRVRTGHDFSHYKRASLTRRIARRMQVVRADDSTQYLDYLRQNSGEVQALFGDILISVTNFFRDAYAFEQLAAKAIPRIFDKKDSEGSIRVWVPGCATGEEAYSIAILLLEEAAKRDVRPEIQVFASDIDGRALAIAREGTYPATIAVDVSEERLRRFFNHEGDNYRVRRELRDLIVFSQHSFMKDPPFSRLDLISCRNVLIYIDRELQQQVFGTFRYALTPDGYLFLGSSEHAEQGDGHFRIVDRGARIYQSLGKQDGHLLPFPGPRSAAPLLESTAPTAPRDRNAAHADLLHQHRQALSELAPPSVLVDELHRIVHVSEKAGTYLLHPPGLPTLDITEVVRPELATELRLALHRALEEGTSSLSLPVAVQFNGHMRHVCVQASPVGVPPLRALVLFIEGGPAEVLLDAGDAAGSDDPKITELREELLSARAQLKLSRQQHEATTENLRAANEELQSINEEYRSTAEELETSREELQSMNEELQTLNSELKLKLDLVSRAHSDLENLMIATDVGTLFLDGDLKIKRLTPRVSDLFNVTAKDEGRRITDLTQRFDHVHFERDVRNSMAQEKAIEKEVHTVDDRWFLMTIRPYRTTEGRIDGVLATFVDVTARWKAEDKLQRMEASLSKPGKKPKR